VFDREIDISVLEGVETLTNLRQLVIGRNHIEHVGTVLRNCSLLEELNIAGNNIWSFDDILELESLPHLTRVAFSDPDYGDNPVCGLSNFHTYVLVHVKHLTQLDQQLVTEEHKRAAEATYLKKRLYYNMRIKTMKRSLNQMLCNAFELKQSTLHVHVHTCQMVM